MLYLVGIGGKWLIFVKKGHLFNLVGLFGIDILILVITNESWNLMQLD